jgi:phage N-6-adenine-methyltransferase
MADERDGEWETPLWLFLPLHKLYKFQLDAAASKANALCKRFFTKEHDALARPWDAMSVWCNPPYGKTTWDWVAYGRAQAAAKLGRLVCMHIPHKADVNSYFDDIKIGRVCFEERFTDGRGKDGILTRRMTDNLIIDIREYRQRISYGGTSGTGWFASMDVVYKCVAA